MKDWQFSVVVISLMVGILSFLWGMLWMTMAKDIAEKSAMQEQAIIEYKWQLEECYYICQGRE